MLAIPSEYFHKPLAGLLYSSVAVPGQYFCTTAMMTLDNCAPPQKKPPTKNKNKQTKPTDNDISIEYVEKKMIPVKFTFIFVYCVHLSVLFRLSDSGWLGGGVGNYSSYCTERGKVHHGYAARQSQG